MRAGADNPPHQTPQPTPEGTAFAPESYPVALVVKAGDMLVGVIALADDGEVMDVKTLSAQFADGGFGFGMVGESGDNRF